MWFGWIGEGQGTWFTRTITGSNVSVRRPRFTLHPTTTRITTELFLFMTSKTNYITSYSFVLQYYTIWIIGLFLFFDIRQSLSNVVCPSMACHTNLYLRIFCNDSKLLKILINENSHIIKLSWISPLPHTIVSDIMIFWARHNDLDNNLSISIYIYKKEGFFLPVKTPKMSCHKIGYCKRDTCLGQWNYEFHLICTVMGFGWIFTYLDCKSDFLLSWVLHVIKAHNKLWHRYRGWRHSKVVIEDLINTSPHS